MVGSGVTTVNYKKKTKGIQIMKDKFKTIKKIWLIYGFFGILSSIGFIIFGIILKKSYLPISNILSNIFLYGIAPITILISCLQFLTILLNNYIKQHYKNNDTAIFYFSSFTDSACKKYIQKYGKSKLYTEGINLLLLLDERPALLIIWFLQSSRMLNDILPWTADKEELMEYYKQNTSKSIVRKRKLQMYTLKK